MNHSKLLLAAASLLALPFFATGCSTSFNPTLTGTGAVTGAAISGKVMGGQQPIVGARIYLLVAGTGGYGTFGGSLLTSQPNTTYDGFNYFATTNASGSFSITGDYTCPSSSTQVYLVSESGNAGSGNNDAAQLMAALGSCGNLSSSSFIVMNELTTVAGVTALQQFFGPTISYISSSSGNAVGLQNAMLAAQTLVNIANGVPQTSNSQLTLPSAKIYTLGNSLAACVNTAGAGSPPCKALFAAAIDESNPGTQPTNTINAMLNIARYPSADPTDVYNVPTGVTAFGNGLPAAPSDFALPVAYTAGALNNGSTGATSIAIDSNGYAYVAVCGQSCQGTNYADALTEIRIAQGASAGFPGSGAPYAQGSVYNTQAIALDQSNFLWATNLKYGNIATSDLSIYRPDQTAFNAAVTNAQIVSPQGIAIGTDGNGWVTDASGAVYSVSASGGVSHPLGNPLSKPLYNPKGIVGDSNGDVIIADMGTQGHVGGTAIFVPGAGTTYTETYSTSGSKHPSAINVDSSHRIWELDSSALTMYRLTEAGALSTSAAIPNAAIVLNFTIDGSSNLVIPVCGNTCTGNNTDPSDSIAFLDSTGAPITGRSGLQDASLSEPVAVAIDGSGNAWVANGNSGAVTMFVGIASPLVTPTSVALVNGTVSTRP